MSDSPPSHPWDRRLGFWWIAEDRPDLPAVLDGPDGSVTYGELASRAHQLVHLFRSLGAEPGRPVAVMVDNGTTILEVSLACHESGLHLIPLNTHLTAAELRAILTHADAAVLVVGERFVGLADAVTSEVSGITTLVAGDGSADIGGHDRLGDARATHPRNVPDHRSQGGLFVYTSGTTGAPKGIRRPLPSGEVGRLANDASVFGRAFDFRPFEGPMLVSTAMFHGGSHIYYMGGLNVGHSLVIMDRFDPERALRLIGEHRVTSGYMVPTQFHRLLQLPDEVRGRYDTSSLHSIVHSAAPCPREVKEAMMRWWGPVIWETYGGVEGAATIAKPKAWLEHPGTVGRAVRGVRVAILDDDGEELPTGEVGHVYVDNGVGFTYHDDPEQTSAAFRGSRFSLGDMGYLDDDGYLFLADRAKDMVITGGTNVYPAEVEGVLLQHRAVADVAVLGLPNPDWGETVTAVVQLGEGVPGGPEMEAELLEHCRERLGSYKVPRRWVFVDDLERTDAGKVYKRRWRERLTAK